MKKRITIHTENSIYVIDPDDVLYCHCNNVSTIIYIKDNEQLSVLKNLDAIEKLLEGNGFIRPNPAFLVNKSYILRVEIDDNPRLILSNQAHIPVSGKTQEEILEIIKI